MSVSENKQLKDISFEKVKQGDKLYVSYIVFSQKNIDYYPDQVGTVIKINKTKRNNITKDKIDKVISKEKKKNISKEKRKVTSIVLLNDKNEEITVNNQDDCEGFGGYTNDHSVYLKKLILQ